MNENKFNEKGNVYAKARPDYPKTLFYYLQSKNILDSSMTVADIGSGTGIFTVQLSPLVNKLYAVEPNDDMRQKAEDRFHCFPNIVSVNATAEKTSLNESSVDVVTVAQAFHWFDRTVFKKECQRILKPNGKVVLVWNDRDINSQIIKDNFAVNQKFCSGFKGSSNGMDFSKDSFSDFFKGEFQTVEFDNSLIYDKNAFVARNLSSSYAPKFTDSYYEEYVKEIINVFDKHNKNGTVQYPYITRCYIGNV